MCSRVQLTIIAGMAVTFFVVLLILRKPLIEFIPGYYSCKLINSNNSKPRCTAIRLLAFQYSHQQACVRLQNTCTVRSFPYIDGKKVPAASLPFIYGNFSGGNVRKRSVQ